MESRVANMAYKIKKIVVALSSRDTEKNREKKETSDRAIGKNSLFVQVLSKMLKIHSVSQFIHPNTSTFTDA